MLRQAMPSACSEHTDLDPETAPPVVARSALRRPPPDTHTSSPLPFTMAQVAFNIGYVKTTVTMAASAAELPLFESTQPK